MDWIAILGAGLLAAAGCWAAGRLLARLGGPRDRDGLPIDDRD